jgi:hypothetical protein
MSESTKSFRERRVTVNLQTSLTDSTGTDIKVIVLDLSREGVRLRVGEPLFVGETVALHMGRSGYARVQILWVAGIEAGGAFLDMH